MQRHKDWMPVFVAFPATARVSATTGPIQESQETAPARTGQDYLQRIGTAIAQPDGTLHVRLVALPISGKLVIRPRREDEFLDPTESQKDED
jgi:hypothetical protein